MYLLLAGRKVARGHSCPCLSSFDFIVSLIPGNLKEFHLDFNFPKIVVLFDNKSFEIGPRDYDIRGFIADGKDVTSSAHIFLRISWLPKV